MVTNRLIDQLEKGVIPWQKPWSGVRSGAYNRISNKPYSLLNQMLLTHTGEYATFKQWSDLGSKIKKGEKSEIVVLWKIQNVKETKEDGSKDIKQIPLLRYFNIFHISQAEGVEPKEIDFSEVKSIDSAEDILNGYVQRKNIKMEHTASNEAYYSPVFDLILLPLKEQFTDIEEYYSTAFHEATHSTGNKDRLNRLNSSKKASFGSETYSKEELIAEIGSSMILNIIGIDTSKTFKNSAAYIQSWIMVLKNDVRFTVSASSKAEKAVNYIME